MQIATAPTPHIPQAQITIRKRWETILNILPPGKYRMKQVAHQCNLNYYTLATMLDRHHHPQIISPKGRQGLERTVTILAFPQVHFKPVLSRYPSPYQKPTSSHGKAIHGGRR